MSIWKDDPIPNKNTVDKELTRMYRIIQALAIAFEEKRTKHVRNDLEELLLCHEELERLTKGGDTH